MKIKNNYSIFPSTFYLYNIIFGYKKIKRKKLKEKQLERNINFY